MAITMARFIINFLHSICNKKYDEPDKNYKLKTLNFQAKIFSVFKVFIKQNNNSGKIKGK